MRPSLLALALGGVLLGIAGHTLSPSRWVTSIDSRSESQWVAEGPGRVYALRGGHPIAIDAASGRVLWTSALTAAGHPGARDTVIAVPVPDGVSFLDPSSGTLSAKYPMPGPPTIVATASAVDAISFAGGVALVAAFDHHGSHLWTKRITIRNLTQAYALGGDAVGLFSAGQEGVLVIDGLTGAAVARASDVDELVGADGRYLWFMVPDGGIKGLDLDTAATFSLHGAIVKGAVRVEHGIAVAVIDGRLQKIDLAHGGHAVPLKIDGRWAGGPVDGKIFVERSDGLYIQSLASTARAKKVVGFTGDTRMISSDRKIAFVGMADGRVFVIDTARERLITTVMTPCRFYEGFTASGNTSVVHCDADTSTSELIGFERFAVTQ